VVPHHRGLYAVDVQLLRFLTDEFAHAGGNFSSAVKVWVGQHQEQKQKELLLGQDLILLPQTVKKLSDAWYVWQVISQVGAQGRGIVWDFRSDVGLERTLTKYVPLLRESRLEKTIQHVLSCPVCQYKFSLTIDGKTAKRRICANLDGFWEVPELQVSVQSGCWRHAASGQLYCKACKPIAPHAPIPQLEVLGQEICKQASGERQIKYKMRCHDPKDASDIFECLLPRAEVMPDLLEAFEKTHLKKPRVRLQQSARKAAVKRAAAKRKTKKGKVCRRAAPTKKLLKKQAKTKPRPGVGCSSKDAQAFDEGWLRVTEEDEKGSLCHVDKMGVPRSLRRTTGGIGTCVLPCGLLFDFVELWRGESLQLMYALLLRCFKRAREAGLHVSVVFYDNACKLLSVVKAKRASHTPLTEELACVRFLLDGLHRDNHTWCLEHLPEVDPERPENLELREGLNSMVAEEYNSWINERTLPATEMTFAHYHIYWWSLFGEHNEGLEAKAAAERRRFSKGHMKHDPDKPRVLARQATSDHA
jgi:uncharacterized protein YbaR (Trm112 family)